MQIINEPWALSGEETLLALGTKELGLSEKEAESRLAEYGTNVFHGKEKLNIFSLFFKQFLSPLIFLLIAASVITGFLHEWGNTIIIGIAVLLNVALGFWHEYHAENTLDSLKGYIKERTRVIRAGREEEIDSSLLVPGDIVKLSYGRRVPADIRILSINNLETDEAILTGESIPVTKNEEAVEISVEVAERKNVAHSGTLAVQGFATGVVYATGNRTEIGKIAGIVSKINRMETPLSRGVSHLAWFIFGLVILIVAGIVVLGVSRGEPLLTMLVLSAAIAVGAVPESLPITLTMILAIGSTRIAKKKGIVKKLSAAETLGSTTLIMTDKTGTLTKADMQLTGIYSKEAILKDESEEIGEGKSISKEQEKLLELSLLNLDVSIENADQEKNKWTFDGRPFEVNIAKAALKHNIPMSLLAGSASFMILPFNSTNKFSVSEKDGKYIVMGAPDVLLKRSNVSKEEYIKIESWIDKKSGEGERLIGLAILNKKNDDKEVSPEEVNDLKFLGAFVFFDPLRPEVPEAIKNIESHGIKIVLVTGDLKGTAVFLAKSLGWEIGGEEVLVGTDLRAMSDEELIAILPKVKIFARVTPEDKFRIGKLYQKLGHVVAMTGDGVNDAPALKAVDIGISLGSGSDVAKSAADLVLLDDNFWTISMAVDEGRKILANIRKAIVYLMSNSLDEIFVVGGSLLFGFPLPLTALQIIWVNLLTGSLPAISFAFDENFDKEKYRGKNLKLIFSKEVKFLTFVVGTISTILLFVLYELLLSFWLLPVPVARSIFFVCFSSYALFIAFSLRSLRRPLFSYNIFSNKVLNWSVATGLGILIATMAIAPLRELFEIAPLPLAWIPFILFWIVFNILLVEGAKYLFRSKIFFSRE